MPFLTLCCDYQHRNTEHQDRHYEASNQQLLPIKLENSLDRSRNRGALHLSARLRLAVLLFASADIQRKTWIESDRRQMLTLGFETRSRANFPGPKAQSVREVN